MRRQTGEMRQRWWAIVPSVLVMSACFSGNPCSKDADCRGGGVCDPDLKICMQPVDSGTGGGGGAETPCAAGCAEWQTCKPVTVSTGVCVNATIIPVSPLETQRLTRGNSVSFVFEVTQWDGGVWPADEVPLWKSSGMIGPQSLSKSGSQFRADVQLAMTGERQGVVAGWTEVDAGIFINTVACNVSCNPWEECVPDGSGGACADLGLSMTFVAPTENYEFGPVNFGQVPLTLRVQRADGGAFAVPVPFELSNGATLLAEGTLENTAPGDWTGTVDAGPDDGTRSVSAGWDGGPKTTRLFRVTATPPSVAIYPAVVTTRPENQRDSDGQSRWKKSDVAPLRVESNRPLVGLTAAAFENPGVSAVSCASGSCDAGMSCYCFAVDLAQQSLVQEAGKLYGTSSVTLNAVTDALGNTKAATSTGAFDVTRLKWSFAAAVGSVSVGKAGLAVSQAGVVLVAANASPEGASLTAIASDGGLLWRSPFSSNQITSGPIVGSQWVYVASSVGSEGRLKKSDLSGNAGPDTCTSVAGTYQGDMALTLPDAGEFPVAMRSDGFLTSATTSVNCATTATSVGSLGANEPFTILSGDAAYVARPGKLSVWKFQGLAGPSNIETLGSKVVGSLTAPTSLFTLGSGIFGGGGSAGGAFVFEDFGGALDGGSTINDMPGVASAGGAVVGAGVGGSEIYYGDSAGSLRRIHLVASSPPTLGAEADSGPLGTDLSVASPLVGAGSRIYVVDIDRSLRVLNANTLASEWYWTTSGDITSQLNMDKNRDVLEPCGAGQPGVLYVVTSTNTVVSVYAVLVDSPGLDGNAPWPRYQHDPGNSGNGGTGLGPWTCP